MVGVKRLAGDVSLARHHLLVRDIIDLWVAGYVHLALIVLKQFAEDLRGGNELWRCKLLTSDHQHVMIGEGTVQRGTGFVVDWSVQIDATHFRSGMRGQTGDRVFHRAASSTSAAGATRVCRPALRFASDRRSVGRMSAA